MRYVAIAFAGEGPTDYKFIAPLVGRHTEALLLERSDDQVQLGPVLSVLPGGRPTNQADAVAREFASGAVYADVLFVHTDAGSSVQRAIRERVDPVREALAGIESPPRVVGVVPARETEAWMVSDPRALERVLGLREGVLDSAEPPSRVHRLKDPKVTLASMVSAVNAAASRRSRSRRHADQVERLYSGLAAEMAFDVLTRIPSFRTYASGLEDQLREIGLIT